MTDLSTIPEEQIVVSEDKKTATRYKVVKEVIDLEALRQEKEALEYQLAVTEPSKEELIELGKGQHAFYIRDSKSIQQRLDMISKILGIE